MSDEKNPTNEEKLEKLAILIGDEGIDDFDIFNLLCKKRKSMIEEMNKAAGKNVPWTETVGKLLAADKNLKDAFEEPPNS